MFVDFTQASTFLTGVFRRRKKSYGQKLIDLRGKKKQSRILVYSENCSWTRLGFDQYSVRVRLVLVHQFHPPLEKAHPPISPRPGGTPRAPPHRIESLAAPSPPSSPNPATPWPARAPTSSSSARSPPRRWRWPSWAYSWPSAPPSASRSGSMPGSSAPAAASSPSLSCGTALVRPWAAGLLIDIECSKVRDSSWMYLTSLVNYPNRYRTSSSTKETIRLCCSRTRTRLGLSM